jgi:hypothetical protein
MMLEAARARPAVSFLDLILPPLTPDFDDFAVGFATAFRRGVRIRSRPRDSG